MNYTLLYHPITNYLSVGKSCTYGAKTMEKIEQKTGFTLEQIVLMNGEELFLKITKLFITKKITKEEHQQLLDKWFEQKKKK
jgi:hypothetical protein